MISVRIQTLSSEELLQSLEIEINNRKYTVLIDRKTGKVTIEEPVEYQDLVDVFELVSREICSENSLAKYLAKATISLSLDCSKSNPYLEG